MTADWVMDIPEDASAGLLHHSFDTSLLTLVVRGRWRSTRWELYDGPHPLIQAPDAVGHNLVFGLVDDAHVQGGGGGVGARLTREQVAVVSSTATDDRRHRIGFLTARCSPAVEHIEITFTDASTLRLKTTPSNSTGQHWIVCCLDETPSPVRIDFLASDGAVLESQPVTDPRQRLPLTLVTSCTPTSIALIHDRPRCPQSALA